MNELLRTASEQGIAVIDFGQDKSRDHCLESILRQVVTDRIDSKQFKIADLTGAGNMLLKIEILVEGDTTSCGQLKKVDSGFHLDRQRKGETGFFGCV